MHKMKKVKTNVNRLPMEEESTFALLLVIGRTDILNSLAPVKVKVAFSRKTPQLQSNQLRTQNARHHNKNAKRVSLKISKIVNFGLIQVAITWKNIWYHFVTKYHFVTITISLCSITEQKCYKIPLFSWNSVLKSNSIFVQNSTIFAAMFSM